ncbi:MAG: helix-turn-helix transcriptional regulator [Methylococcales bacterium]|jgi:transcriptional regulator with XRE-family HTH domain|nr:helix-turn-helix transcriptional regulator [Methylococcales bacterium]MDP3008764.1 helix-turn-helix transcriptional regulator [Methylococcales bacterium]MDP3839454.1 helix-turn-helix transcriptional regulator [Methylococcales bacterium]
MKELVKTLVKEFDDKEYAHAYMEEVSNMAIAAQIKVLREQRNWTQVQLAKAADMKQERISALENVDYDAWTLKTLRKLAKAFDLTIKVSFEKFSDGILDISKLNAENLKRTSREQDLKEFYCNGFGYEKIFWGATVTTTPSLRLIQNNAVNDKKYSESNRQVA